MDLTEAKEIKRRWQEYTEELYKKGLNDPENQDCVITHLEPDILEYEVKWALGIVTMSKARKGDGVPAELNTRLNCIKSFHQYHHLIQSGLELSYYFS